MSKENSRKRYSKAILGECIDLLKSYDEGERYKGVVFAAYLVEQSFKHFLREINPFLYFSRRDLNPELIIKIASQKRLSPTEMLIAKTITPTECINYICIFEDELKEHRLTFEELFNVRNHILHSIDDLFLESEKAAETAVSALKASKNYISNYLEIENQELNPLTSKEFNKLQEEEHRKRLNNLKDILKYHRIISDKLTAKEIEARLRESRNLKLAGGSANSWVEETFECPACGQPSLDKIGSVDFDWNPDGIIESGGYSYSCRVCDLDLSEYEFNLASSLPIDPILST